MVFSGLIQAIGEVRAVATQHGGARVEIACTLPGGPFEPGESIAVSGPCLSVAGFGTWGFAAEVSPETLRRTTLGRLRPGARVNLERSLRLADRLGGHLVMGHVDATTRLVAVRPVGAFVFMRFGLPRELATEVAEKGSVALDGVSLTVSALGDGWFETAAIPATLESTTLGLRRAGDELNLETDVIAKYVRRALGQGRPGLEQLLDGLGGAQD